MSRDVLFKMWFSHLGLVKLNGVERMQTNAFVHEDKGACLLACSGLALKHSLLLFPLHRFLSLFMSKFNQDNRLSQAHFSLQQLSNTS